MSKPRITPPQLEEDEEIDLSLKGWDLAALLAAIAFMFLVWLGATHFVHL